MLTLYDKRAVAFLKRAFLLVYFLLLELKGDTVLAKLAVHTQQRRGLAQQVLHAIQSLREAAFMEVHLLDALS